MKSLFCAFILSVASLNAYESEIQEPEKILKYISLEEFEIIKMQIEEHSYFILRNFWQEDKRPTNHFWHDPDCAKCNPASS